MTQASNSGIYSRGGFLRLRAGSAASLAIGAGAKSGAAQNTSTKASHTPAVYDLRGFVRWIIDDFQPSVRLPGGAGLYASKPGLTIPALYGVADMAYILYTIGALQPTAIERAEWKKAFELFQNPKSGWFLAGPHSKLQPLHNTSFVLGAMQLLDITPRYPVKMSEEYSHPRAFLNSLNWRTQVYHDSHKGGTVGTIYALVPALRSSEWFDEYFSTLDGLVDPVNGLIGQDKPRKGDIDQVGGTYHYSFIYEYFNRQMPYPTQRIDTVLGLQRHDGYWSSTNHLWMTIDAIYLMTRTLRYCPHRLKDVQASVRKIMGVLQGAVYSPEGRKATFAGRQAVHSLTAVISIAAAAQQFLGAHEVITDWPLKLVMDHHLI